MNDLYKIDFWCKIREKNVKNKKWLKSVSNYFWMTILSILLYRTYQKNLGDTLCTESELVTVTNNHEA